MKQQLIKQLSKHLSLSKQEIELLLEVPPTPEFGDFSIPCFILSKSLKIPPQKIAEDLSKKIFPSEIERTEVRGAYLNFFLNKNLLAEKTLKEIFSKKEKYGSTIEGKNKTVVIDMSSPNIAKPFGIGHLRSTIIGNSLAQIAKFKGYNVIKINYFGDWGTPFGKIIAGFKEFGSEKELKKDSVKHLYEIYLKVSKDEKFEELGRTYFKKLERGDKEILSLWKKFKKLSSSNFDKIYKMLGVKFEVTIGESFYNDKMESIIKELEKKHLLEKSEGAKIVNLEKYNLGVVLIQKQDGTTLYATRDIIAAIHRKKEYDADYLFYEVGSEQKLYFKQLFKILELLGYKWAKNCVHIDHGLYLGTDGKKLATRKGKTIFMQDILNETISLSEKEISKREKVSKAELSKRALAITRAAIIYGDLKNFRANDIVFDLNKFVSFEGNTGPYILYTYARAKSILKKVNFKNKSIKIPELNVSEKKLFSQLASFSHNVQKSYESFAPNQIANYTYHLAQLFNEFYHSNKVLGSENEQFLLSIVAATAQVLKNAFVLLGIPTLERM